MIEISADVARRFILGRQGLWPGRRWRGLHGTEEAMRAMEYLQLDPLQIVARSHDIKLHSRVLDYTPGLWEEVTYGQRKFFDWGGWLEDEALGHDDAFAQALALGFARFVTFLGADRLDAGSIREPRLRDRVGACVAAGG